MKHFIAWKMNGMILSNSMEKIGKIVTFMRNRIQTASTDYEHSYFSILYRIPKENYSVIFSNFPLIFLFQKRKIPIGIYRPMAHSFGFSWTVARELITSAWTWIGGSVISIQIYSKNKFLVKFRYFNHWIEFEFWNQINTKYWTVRCFFFSWKCYSHVFASNSVK